MKITEAKLLQVARTSAKNEQELFNGVDDGLVFYVDMGLETVMQALNESVYTLDDIKIYQTDTYYWAILNY